jgi:hypothetical protein
LQQNQPLAPEEQVKAQEGARIAKERGITDDFIKANRLGTALAGSFWRALEKPGKPLSDVDRAAIGYHALGVLKGAKEATGK